MNTYTHRSMKPFMGVVNVEFMILVISEERERADDWRRDTDVFILSPIFTIMFKSSHDKKE